MLRTYLDYSVLDGARNIPIFLTVGISEHATENSIRYYVSILSMTSCISVGISDIVWSREKSDLYVENPVNLERLSKENLRKSQRCKIVISLPTIEPKQRNEIIHLSIVTNSRGNSQAGCLPVATKLRTVDSLNAMHHANASALDKYMV